VKIKLQQKLRYNYDHKIDALNVGTITTKMANASIVLATL